MKNKGKTKAELLKELEILREEQGKGVFKDITERIQLEKKLKDSEERLKILFDYAPDAYYISDLKGNFIDGNKAAERVIGYKREELIGKSFLKLKLLSLADIPKAAKLLMKNLRGQSTGPDEFVLNRKDNSKLTVEISTYPVKIKERTLVLGIARDITERKRSEEEIRLHAAMMDNVAEGVYLIGLDDLLIRWTNERFARMFGYDPGEMVGKHVDIINAPTTEVTPAETRIAITDVLKETGEWHGEIRNIKRDGTHFWCYANISLFDHPEYGKIIVAVSNDITKRKQAEERLKKTINATIETVSKTIETKDPYTSGHQHRVSQLATAIAKELNLSPDKIEGIRIASLIHDIGKIGLPTEILSKPTKLTDMEFNLIKEHSQKGYNILKPIDFSYPIAQIVLQHHERLNGSGYPNNLKGNKILLEARIIGIADVVEAMSSHRPYRPAWGIDKALEEISKNKGILYDPEVVDTCLKLFKENGFKFK